MTHFECVVVLSTWMGIDITADKQWWPKLHSMAFTGEGLTAVFGERTEVAKRHFHREDHLWTLRD